MPDTMLVKIGYTQIQRREKVYYVQITKIS